MQLDFLNFYRATLLGKLPQILIVTWKINLVFYLKKEILIWLFFGFLCVEGKAAIPWNRM